MLHPLSHLLAFPFLFKSWTSTTTQPPLPEDCSSNTNNYKLTLSVLILVGIIVSYLPQHYRIIRKRSSDGFSPWFLLLGCLSTCWSFFNIVMLQSKSLRCCTLGSTGRCLESALGIAQLFVQFVLFSLIFVLYIMYFPPDKKINKLRYKLHLMCLPSRSFAWSISLFFAKVVAGNFAVSLIFTTILLVFVRDTIDNHSVWTLIWAGFLGVTSVLLTMIQYIPQIIETYLRKSVGALSISMMWMQTPGAIFMTISLALTPGSNWSTWVPYGVAAFFQAVLLGMCVYYRFHTKRLGLSSFHTAETTPLLAGQGSKKPAYNERDRENGQALGELSPMANKRASVV